MQNPKLRKTLKSLIVILIIAATFLFFGYYIIQHPEVADALLQLNLPTLLLLTLGYSLVTLINAWILFHSLRFVGKKVSLLENTLITGYSSIVNFFGPLQSGPGVRAVYLKKRHGVKLRDFFVATLIFYGFFAVINGLILLLAVTVQVQTAGFYMLIAVGALAGILLFRSALPRFPRFKIAIDVIRSRLWDKDFWFIGAGALALTLATTITYFVEIYHVDTSVSLMQTLVYTAAADLALFVSLTPGAIGIREAFLVFSQQLHGIDTATIIGASVIDRAFYVAFLLILFVVLLIVNSRMHLFNIGRSQR